MSATPSEVRFRQKCLTGAAVNNCRGASPGDLASFRTNRSVSTAAAELFRCTPRPVWQYASLKLTGRHSRSTTAKGSARARKAGLHMRAKRERPSLVETCDLSAGIAFVLNRLRDAPDDRNHRMHLADRQRPFRLSLAEGDPAFPAKPLDLSSNDCLPPPRPMRRASASNRHASMLSMLNRQSPPSLKAGISDCRSKR